MKTIYEIFNFIDSYESKFFLGSIEDDRIKAAEDFLNIKFPDSYRQFIQKYGCGNCGSVELYGITKSDFDKAVVPNSIGLTKSERVNSGLPINYIIISDSMNGLAVLKISNSYHDIGVFEWISSDIEPSLIANSFIEYLDWRFKNEL
jgi:hypothetical protein